MILMLLAAGAASLACAMAVAVGSLSPAGKALGLLSAALGIVLGVTVGSVTASLGADERTAASVGLLACSSAMIAGCAAARKLIRKAKPQSHS